MKTKNTKCQELCSGQTKRQYLTEALNTAELALLDLTNKKIAKNLKTYFKHKQILSNLVNDGE